MVDNREHIIIQRGKDKSYRLLPITEDDYITNIPEEFLCNPFDISPKKVTTEINKRQRLTD